MFLTQLLYQIPQMADVLDTSNGRCVAMLSGFSEDLVSQEGEMRRKELLHPLA